MKRRVFIGDVHGCASELDALLSKIAVTGDDEVYFVGDLVVRGPRPAEVLQLVQQVDGRSVRGNHEQRLLRWRQLKTHQLQPVDDRERRLAASSLLEKTASLLDEVAWAYIEETPLWIDVPEIEVVVVHAAIETGLSMQNQAEHTLLYIRSVDEAGCLSASRDAGPSWASSHMGPPHVVFGHNARHEPQLHAWATGLDTGCVYGGALTALVLPSDRVPAPAERAAFLVQVPAAKTYYRIA